MKERWRCFSMGPVAMPRPPPGTSSQTQPDGRPAYYIFPFRPGQRGIAPLCVRPLGGAGGADLSVYDGFLKGAVAVGS